MADKTPQTCANCGKEIKGRTNKRFCDDLCRNTWHNEQGRQEAQFTTPINAILKKNRKILKDLNITGKSKVPKDKLLAHGFQFDYLTRMYTTKKGSTYFFCYEQGYLPLDNDWYMLVVDGRVST